MSGKIDTAEQLERLRLLPEYRMDTCTAIPEIGAVGVTMEHRRTGARIFLLLCDDENKVFTIGFRTPSINSCGAAHIVEHTTLCGSRKYPSKDPFVELVKGSLNTFLNAMTYPDKTIYPAASCNEKDFENLCDVYLDAVFHPNFYREKKIFEQEGWHYEAEDADSPLTLNGVVYNEMKGAYSSVDGIMERAVNQVLFPGHPYAEESGGDPDNIPDLTYEAYLDFHRRYYHPSNSYIYFYGDLDMAERLTYLDREYLSHYDRRPVDSAIRMPVPFEAPVERVFPYSVSESEPEETSWYFSLNTRVGGELDPLLYNAFQILEYVLLEAPGAPLHDALIDAGIGSDVYGGYSYGIRDPYFAVTADHVSADQKDEFLRIVREVLKKLADEGLDHDTLRAAVNLNEFRAREADFGSYPKGLMYGIECFNSWLYDADPCMHLKFADMFAELREKIDEGYFEMLIRTRLLGNPNEALVILKPVRGLTEKKDETLREKLKKKAAGMSREKREEIARETKALKAYQSEPSPEEDLRKIPLLKRSDIGREAEHVIFEERTEDSIPVIASSLFTSHIVYLKLLFDCSSLSLEDLSRMALLRDLLGYLDTKEHSYGSLSTEVNLNTGGTAFSIDCYPDLESGGSRRIFSAGAKVFPGKISFALRILREMLLETRFDDIGRFLDNLLEVRTGLRDRLLSSGHTTALNRAGSFLSEVMAVNDATKGISYYKFLEAFGRDQERAARAAADLRSLCGKIFTADNLRIHITADEEDYRSFAAALQGFRGTWPETADRPSAFEWKKLVRSEAWESASRVNYAARFGNFRDHGYPYTGALRILKLLLSYDYLWNRIRVQGGAYGCMANFGRSGNSGFVSYRDPKILETDQVYDGIADYAEHFTASEREMTKSIIGTIAELDMPLTPVMKGSRGLSAYYSHVTDEDLQKERDEILDATPKDINALAPLLRSVLSDGARCVIGNETQIRQAESAFTEIRPLVSAEGTA